MVDLAIVGVSELATPTGTAPRTGSSLGQLRITQDATVAVRGDRIVFVGTTEEYRSAQGPGLAAREIDGRGRTLLPGFVDAHTHLPFAGWRETEFDARLHGDTYSDIAARGGGILSTVRATRATAEADLTATVRGRLDALARLGTTTVEAKSGYGLDPESERKQLRALRAAAAEHPVAVVPTFLGAHTIPAEYREGGRDTYVQKIIERMIPEVASEGLAEFADAFVDAHAFRVDEARSILTTAREHGMRIRLHADQLADDGAAALAAELGAASADHLEYTSDAGIEALARAGTCGVLLPAATFFLMMDRRPPGRRLVDGGVPVVVASDFNPGTCPCESMSAAVWFASLTAGLGVDESITAATLNAACSLGRGEDIGTIEVGKRADLVLHDIPNRYHLVYRFGVPRIAAVVAGGRLIAD